MIIGLIRHGRPTVMRRLLIRSKRRVLMASDYLERALAPGRKFFIPSMIAGTLAVIGCDSLLFLHKRMYIVVLHCRANVR